MNKLAERTTSFQGLQIPTMLYGTAWKEERTQSLVELALEKGFRGIDTANQRKHYYEEAVGRGIRSSCDRLGIERKELFIQTKFTHLGGQDHRLPYDPKASLTEQVNQSFASSLEHLGTDYIDSYVLHGPSHYQLLTDEDWQAWRAMEGLHRDGGVRFLGVSNVQSSHLESLLADATVKPSFVQNRCFANRGWDNDVRQICRDQGLIYQGFSLLTANPEVLAHPYVTALADEQQCSPSQIVFRFATLIGMQPLTGTTDPHHMEQDLLSYDLQVSEEQVGRLARLCV